MGNENNLNMEMKNHPLVRRMFILIEDDECDKAREVIDKILNEYPECAEAYLGELLLDLGLHTRADLTSCGVDFSENKKYKRALMYAEGELKEFLEGASIVSLINEFINVTREEGLDPLDVLLNDVCGDEEEEAPVAPNKKIDTTTSNLNNLVGEEKDGDFVFVYKNDHYVLTWYKGKDKVVTVPQSFRGKPVTEIARDAFKENIFINKVVLPEGLREIGIFAFFGCYNLKEVSFPKSLRNICTYSFGRCNSLKEVNFPDKLEYIGIMAFYECYALRKIVVPGSVTKIGRDAFRACNNLSELTVPFIGEQAGERAGEFTHFFDGMENTLFPSSYVPASLKTVVVTGGERVTDEAFMNCRYIQKVTLPKSTSYIGKNAFKGCTALEVLDLTDCAGWHCSDNEREASGRVKNANNSVAIFNSSQCAKIFKGDGAEYYWYK